MHDTASSQGEPRVVTLRVRRRLASLLGPVVGLGMLLALAGSVGAPHDAVVLAVGAPSSPSTADEAAGVDGSVAADGEGDLAPEIAVASASVAATIQQLTGRADGLASASVELLGTLSTSPGSATVDGVRLSWPVRAPEASGFGPRIHPVLGRAMFHTGVDLMAACGTPIHAAADGRVGYAAITPSWGRRVIIRHSTSLETGYAHMSRFLVQEGDVVRRGQVIGLVGTTGWSTGCHLHFDVIVDGKYVDPAPYLGLPGTSSAEVPYHAAPHVETSGPGSGPRTVEDGDVPVTSAVPASRPTGPAQSGPQSSGTPRATTPRASTSSVGTTGPAPTAGSASTPSRRPSTTAATTTTTPTTTTTTTTSPPSPTDSTTATSSPATPPATPPAGTATSSCSCASTTSEAPSPPPTTSATPVDQCPSPPSGCQTATDTAAVSSATDLVATTAETLLTTGPQTGRD